MPTEELKIAVRLQDFATKEFSNLSGTVDQFGRQVGRVSDTAKLKLGRIGSAASQVGTLFGGALGNFVSESGHAVSAINSVSEALGTTGSAGLVGRVAQLGAVAAGAFAIFKAGQPAADALATSLKPISDFLAAGGTSVKLLEKLGLKEAAEAAKNLDRTLADFGKAAPASQPQDKAFLKLVDDSVKEWLAGREFQRVSKELQPFRERMAQLNAETALFGETQETLRAKVAASRAELIRLTLAGDDQIDFIAEVQAQYDSYKSQLEDVTETKLELIEVTQEEIDQQVEQSLLFAKRQQEILEETDLVAGLKAGIRDLSEEYERWGLAARQAVHGVTDSIAGNATNAFLDYLEHVKSGKDAFKDFARSVLRDIARIIIQTLILKAIQGAAGGIGGLFSGGGQNQIDLGGGAGLQPAGFAKGGVVDGHLVPVGHGLQGGGVIQREGLFRIRERGQNEAVVPLPDNRSIPVQFVGHSGAGRGSVINLAITVHYASGATTTAGEEQMMQRNGKQIAAIIASELRQDPIFRESMRTAS